MLLSTSVPMVSFALGKRLSSPQGRQQMAYFEKWKIGVSSKLLLALEIRRLCDFLKIWISLHLIPRDPV